MGIQARLDRYVPRAQQEQEAGYALDATILLLAVPMEAAYGHAEHVRADVNRMALWESDKRDSTRRDYYGIDHGPVRSLRADMLADDSE